MGVREHFQNSSKTGETGNRVSLCYLHSVVPPPALLFAPLLLLAPPPPHRRPPPILGDWHQSAPSSSLLPFCSSKLLCCVAPRLTSCDDDFIGNHVFLLLIYKKVEFLSSIPHMYKMHTVFYTKNIQTSTQFKFS